MILWNMDWAKKLFIFKLFLVHWCTFLFPLKKSTLPWLDETLICHNWGLTEDVLSWMFIHLLSSRLSYFGTNIIIITLSWTSVPVFKWQWVVLFLTEQKEVNTLLYTVNVNMYFKITLLHTTWPRISWVVQTAGDGRECQWQCGVWGNLFQDRPKCSLLSEWPSYIYA